MGSNNQGFRDTSSRAKKYAALVKRANRKRNLEGTNRKRGSKNV